jgi:hypothetical protein
MSMSLSNLVISTKAPVNTIIGQLALYDQSGAAMATKFQLTQNSAGYFVNSGNSLMTSRASIAPGFYSVRVRGVAQMERWKETGNFVIQVTST